VTDGAPVYRTPEAFRRGLEERLKKQAKLRGRTLSALRREFFLQRFLARVFHDQPDSPWILKGGTGLLVRLPGARHSKDIDLLHPGLDLAVATAQLREVAGRGSGDPLRFVVGQPSPIVGGVDGSTIKVEVYLGVTKLDGFPVDLSTKLDFVGPVERRRPLPVVEVPDVGPLPEFTVYPLPDQVADKVCAMFHRYGGAQASSSRFRDLVDLVLIVGAFQLDAGLTAAALKTEALRRGLTLPVAMHAPGPNWADGYSDLAGRTTMLDPGLRDLSAALAAAGRCLDPLLAGTVQAGTWDPAGRCWRSDGSHPG
jgi:hypothetical protein